MRVEVIPRDRLVSESSRRGLLAAVPLPFVALALGAAALRLWNLDGKGLWYDEAYSLFMAHRPLGEMLGLLAAYDNHPPLYYAFLSMWVRIAGDGDIAVRLPSAAASVGVVMVTFLLARGLAGTRVAFLAAGLLALSGFQVVAGQEARMYPFLTLFGVAASYALWRAVQEPHRRRWLVYGLWMLLAAYTHYAAALLLAAHGIYVLAVERQRAAAWIRSTGLVALCSLPLLPLVWPQMATARTLPAFQHSLHWRALLDLMGLLSFGGGLIGTGTYYQRGTLQPLLQGALVLPFLLLILFGFARTASWRRALIVTYVLAPVVITALVGISRDVFQERYFSFIQPAFAILLATGIASLMAGRTFARALAGLALAMVAGLTVAALVGAYRAQPFYDWRGAGRYVTAAARAEDVLLYVPPHMSIAFEHYYRGAAAPPRQPPAQVLAAATQAAQGTLRLRTTFPIAELPAIARAHPRMWIVSSAALGPRVPAGIAEVLAPYFREAEERRFGFVTVSLWESRL